MKLTTKTLRGLIREELTGADKDEIKKIASKEAEKLLQDKKLKDMVEKEVEKALDGKGTKEQIGDITKTVIKQLYKDLSYHHPYIIDRIKI
jgi:fructose-bisphosphate aldolase class 1|tara:strand:- start:1770 stop:2042 length:273 start_codon:yes stop_codon:yes gene_type:complete